MTILGLAQNPICINAFLENVSSYTYVTMKAAKATAKSIWSNTLPAVLLLSYKADLSLSCSCLQRHRHLGSEESDWGVFQYLCMSPVSRAA